MIFNARILPFSASRSSAAKPGNSLLPPLPDATENLAGLITSNTLVVADAENIMISARNHGLEVDFKTLAHKLSHPGANTQLHAAFSSMPGDTRYARMFTASGWEPHVRDIVWVNGSQGADQANDNSAGKVICLPSRRVSPFLLHTTGHHVKVSAKWRIARSAPELPGEP